MPVLRVVVGVGALRGLTGGVGASQGHMWKMKMVYCKLKMYSWKLKMVYWKLETIEHELRSTGPILVPLLATRCLYWRVHLSSGQLDPTSYHSWPRDASIGGGSVWLKCKKDIENLNTLGVLGLVSRRSFLRKTSQWYRNRHWCFLHCTYKRAYKLSIR